MTSSARSAIPIALFCAGIAAIYAIGLISRSVWYDEAITLQSLAAQRFVPPPPGFADIDALKAFFEGTSTFWEVIRRYIETDVHPPFYFLLAHWATLVFGTQLVVARGVSLVLVVASVALFGRTLQRLGEPGPWICLAVYALSFSMLTSAQDARGYGLVLLLVVGAWRVLALAGSAARTGGRAGIWPDILIGLLCGGLLLTHYFALFVVAPLLGWRVLEAAGRRDPAGLVAPLVCAAVFAPWLPVMLDHLGARPDQMTGFHGIAAWAKRMAQLLPAQVLSATHGAVPGLLQMAGRGAVLLLILIGALDALLRGGPAGPRRRFGLIAVWVPGAGLCCFLAASIVMDRWFDTLRYILFFAPFLAYLAGRGAIGLGQALAGAIGGGRAVVLLPGLTLIAAQLAMVNFGWEANRNRGGAYYNSIAAQIEAAGPGKSLAIIDVAKGRGTLLAAVWAFPAGTSAYLLAPDPASWTGAAREIAAALPERDMVVLVYTIQRGDMGSDKATLYGPIVEMLQASGFTRMPAPPVPYGDRFYAKWTRG